MRGLRLPASLAVLSLSILGCGGWPPLSIRVTGDVAEIDVRSLGEYRTEVSRIRVSSEASEETIWEIRNPDAPQIGGFQLAAGTNPVLPDYLQDFGFRVEVPSGLEQFELARGVVYTLQVWGRKGKRPATESFSFPLQTEVLQTPSPRE